MATIRSYTPLANDPTAIAAPLPANTINDSFTVSDPDVPRNLVVHFSENWDGGDVRIIGTDIFNNRIIEVFPTNTGCAVGTKIFKTVTSAKKTQQGFQFDSASIGTGRRCNFVRDDDTVLVLSSINQDFVFELPDSSQVHRGRKYTIKKTDASGNAITIVTANDSLISGNSSVVLDVPYADAIIVGGINEWLLIASDSVALGTQGSSGAQGSMGFQGYPGFGFQGDQGSQGDIGDQGIQGNQGNTGSQSATGPQGSAGVQGATGAQGNQGILGAQGTAGGTADTWREVYIQRGRAKLGLAAAAVSHAWEEWYSSANWTLVDVGSIEVINQSSTADLGGMQILSSATAVTSVSAALLSPASFVLGQELWYIAGRFGAINIGTQAHQSFGAGIFPAAEIIPKWIECGYISAGSPDHWCAAFSNEIATQYLASSIALDGNMHNFEIWFDGTNVNLSVDDESIVTAVATTLPSDPLPLAIFHTRDTGDLTPADQAIDKYLCLVSISSTYSGAPGA